MRLFEVSIEVPVGRKVYIEAESKTEARRLAKDASEWFDASEFLYEDVERVRVLAAARVPEAGT